MKRILIAILAMGMVGCHKAANITPTLPGSKTSSLVTLTVINKVDSNLNISIHYTTNNTGNYIDDILEVFYTDSMTDQTPIDKQGPNTNYSFIPSVFYRGGGYKVFLIRELTTINKDTLAIVVGK